MKYSTQKIIISPAIFRDFFQLWFQLVFLDGEEAFIDWTDTDSIYGARHLAQKWQESPFPDNNSENNILDSIDLFVLLDLLGSKDPRFESHFPNTSNNHRHMQAVEKRLHKSKLLENHSIPNQYFVTSTRYAGRISGRIEKKMLTEFPKLKFLQKIE